MNHYTKREYYFTTMSMNKKNPELYGSGFYYQKIINNYKSIEFPKPLQTLGIDQQLLNCG